MNRWFAALIAICLLALPLATAEEVQFVDVMEVEAPIDEIELELAGDIEDIVHEEVLEIDLGEDPLSDSGELAASSNIQSDAVPNASGVTIDETNFPDENFREWVSNYDTDGDGMLTESEIGSVTDIDFDMYEGSISSLIGIEYFFNLRSLRTQYKTLSALDVSKCTALEQLDCYNNQLVSLDISGCTALERLYCNDNQLVSLDVGKCTALKELHCENNSLISLNVTGCRALEVLACGGNALTNLDVRTCIALTDLICGYALWSTEYGNRLTSLDVSKCKALDYLNCSDNQLTSLDVSKCTALEILSCGGNMLKSLDVSKNTALKELYCGSDILGPSGNQLTTLDVSHCSILKILECSDNRLKSLDIGKCTVLEELTCYKNMLTNLDVNKCRKLKKLRCNDNQLTKLDVSKCTKLDSLYCFNNQLKSLNLSKCAHLKTAIKEGEYTDEGYIRYHYSSFNWEDYDLSCDNNVVITPKPTKAHVAACTVAIEDVVYTGKALKPTMTVKYGTTQLEAGTDYTVSYKNNKKIGTATVIVKGKGSYVGEKTASFNIIPKAVTGLKLKAGKKQLTVSWKKVSGVTGYQLEYSLKKEFSSSKKVTVAKAATVKKTLKNLKKNKIYYVRIRAYKEVNGQTYWSAWSATKKAKVK